MPPPSVPSAVFSPFGTRFFLPLCVLASAIGGLSRGGAASDPPRLSAPLVAMGCEALMVVPRLMLWYGLIAPGPLGDSAGRSNLV